VTSETRAIPVEKNENARSLPAQGSARVSALDGIRGVAILMVMAVHLVVAHAFPEAPGFKHFFGSLLWCGWSGVDLFFVLSGFLITGILIDSRTAPNYFSSFYMRRVLRIFPLYYFVIIALIVIVPLVALKHPWIFSQFPSFAGWVSYFFYYQNWWMPVKEPTRDVFIAHLWSLGVEEQFYLAWPACVWLAKPRRLRWICLGGVVFAPVLRFLLLHPGIGPAIVLSATPSPIILGNTLTRVDTLLIGAFIAIAVRDAVLLGAIRKLQPYVFVASVVGIAVIDLLGHETWSRAYWTETIGLSFYAFAYASIVLWAYLQNGERTWLDRSLNNGLLRMLGKYSYGIYVYHVIIYACLRKALDRYGWYGRSLIPSLCACAGFILVSVGVAVLSFRYLETPFLKLKSRFRRPQSSGLAMPRPLATSEIAGTA